MPRFFEPGQADRRIIMSKYDTILRLRLRMTVFLALSRHTAHNGAPYVYLSS